MRKYRVCIMSFLAALLVIFMAGCGKETVNIPDTTPFVISTTPAQGATGVALNPQITATFNKAMTASTINTSTFIVTGPGGAVTGTVALAGNTATFTPATPLAAQDATYSAMITTGVKDLAGNAMNDAYGWTFETVNIPSAVSTNPAAGATGVAIDQTITATFLQDPDSPEGALNCSTLTTATFTVTAPAGPVAGSVTCAGATATFSPTLFLAQNTTYTATITTGTKNASGNGLATPYVWTFTTGSQPSVISTVPANGATGVLPNQIISAIFSETMNCATLYSPAKTFLVTGPGGISVGGTVNCTGTGATFSPAAPLTPNTLYTATITGGAKDPAGQPLVSGVAPNPWTFRTAPAPTIPTVISTTPVNNATGVPINQKIAATFSEAINPATINNTTFTLTGPGGVSVAGTVTYAVDGSVATFTPAANLAPVTTYVATISTAVQDLAGNGLASNYAFTFTTGAIPDTTKPTVIATIPTNGATGVPFNQAVSATFSKSMDPTTITTATFTLTGPGTTSVTGFVTYAAIGNTATFTPAELLLSGTLYTATITTGVKDLSGNALANNYVFTFTTGTGPDTNPPTIISTNPGNGATDVPINQAVNATFSKAMDPLTITTATFQLTEPGGGVVTGTVAYDAINFIATFMPSAPLTASTTYVATVTAGATDLAGNSLKPGTAPNPWSFTTGAAAAPPPVPLGTAALFGGFGGGAGMTNQGTSTVINGDIGTTGVSTLITGFHDSGPGCTYTETPLNIGAVNGMIDTAPPPPTVACPNEGTAVTSAIAAKAAADALIAYGDLVAFPGGLDVSTCPGCGGGAAGELGGRTLAPGIYKSAPGSYGITIGDLTLDAQGNPNAFWVFQMATTLT
nr:Ig-like domain-containing protein [Armatimonadota bacterium]